MLLISNTSYLEDVVELYYFVPCSFKYLRQYKRICRELFFSEWILWIINMLFRRIFFLSSDFKLASSRRIHHLCG